MAPLRDRPKITAGDRVNELRAGQMLILAAGLSHAVAPKKRAESRLAASLE